MKQISNTLRNIIVLFVFLLFAVAVLWLVRTQLGSEPQTIAQTTDETISPTTTSVAEPTATPFTPEVVMGTVTLITPPPPTPTTGPGDLSSYRINEPVYISLSAADSAGYLGYVGFFSDGSLIAYSFDEDISNPTILSSYLHSDTLDTQFSEWQIPTLNADKLIPAGNYPSINPIQQLGKTDNLIYREKISDNLFEFKMSNLAGQSVVSIGQATSPDFATSYDGLIAYVSNDQIIIQDPLRNNNIITKLSLSDYGFDISNDDFGMALSPGTTHLALHGKGGVKIIALETGQDILVREHDETSVIQEIAWSPDGLQLAYSVGNTSEVGFPGNILSSIYFVDQDGNDQRMVNYQNQENRDPATLKFINWSLDSQMIAVKSVPYTCQICQEAIVLVSKNGNYREIIKSDKGIDLIGWIPDTTQLLGYRCVPPGEQNKILCIVSLSR